MKISAKDTNFRIVNESNEHDENISRFFTGIYNIISPTFFEVAFIPSFNVKALNNEDNIPQDYDDIRSDAEARLITANQSNIVVTPNSYLLGKKTVITHINEIITTNYNRQIIYYVSQKNFDIYTKEIKELIETKNLSIRDFVNAAFLLKYSFVNFIYQNIFYSEEINSRINKNFALDNKVMNKRKSNFATKVFSSYSTISKNCLDLLTLWHSSMTEYKNIRDKNNDSYQQIRSDGQELTKYFERLNREKWEICQYPAFEKLDNENFYIVLSPNGNSFLIDIATSVHKRPYYSFLDRNSMIAIKSKEREYLKNTTRIICFTNTAFEIPTYDRENNIYSLTPEEIFLTLKRLDSKLVKK